MEWVAALAWNRWQVCSGICNFKSFVTDTTKLFTIIDESEKLRICIESCSNLKIIALDSENLNKLIQETEYNDLLKTEKDFKKVIKKAIEYLNCENFHPIAKVILCNLENIDVDCYKGAIQKLGEIVEQQIRYFNFQKLKTELEEILPNLISHILSDEFLQLDSQEIQQAINFRHAQNEIQKLMDIDYERTVSVSLSNAEQLEKDLIAKIASEKAWLHVLERLKQNRSLGNHLKAFSQAVKKIGKTGVGKRATRFIKIAQQEMGKCKTAVPCWIMPLYKVVESIQPEQVMYDYVIIDEASQLGVDAIFLLYIAKNIIIVGDDKQTSPEYVGLKDNAMKPFIKKHLEGIPYDDFYGTEFSFFDHAERFCGDKIVLREHFRCMPEIIEFCNENFYKPDGIGLYPLKQYSENRLDPLKNIYCQNGHVEGKFSSITNDPEAKRLVEEIAKLVNEKRYDGKSFGVITLQGNKQAEKIEALLLKQIGEPEFKKRNILCGNSTSFQGDERDIIFLSLVTAHNHNRSALTQPMDERRFNVAVSRAKEQIWLFHSVEMEDLNNPDDLRYKLLTHFKNYRSEVPIAVKTIPIPPRPRPLHQQPKPFDSWFEVDVYNDIICKGYSVIAQYEIAIGSYRIDLVVILLNGTKIAIECDGDYWHSADQYQKDMMRQRDLERCGWQFFRVRGSTYYTNRKKALEPLWEMLPDLPTVPLGVSSNKDKKPDVLAITPTPINTKTEVNQPEGQIDIFGNFDDAAEDKTQPQRRQEPTLYERGEFLVFTNHFNVYKLKNISYTKKEAIDKVKAEFQVGEKNIYTIRINDFSGFLIIAFENGKIAKVKASNYKTKTNRKQLKKAYSNDSNLVSIQYFMNDIDLVAISTAEKVVLFNSSKINAIDTKDSKGIQIIKLKEGGKLKAVKMLEKVKFENPEYYRFNIPATGNNLSKNDVL